MAQPSNVTVNARPASYVFRSRSRYLRPSTYQWQRRSSRRFLAQPLLATRLLRLPAADNGATFRVIVSNSVGSVPSNAATLTVDVPPSITAQPASQTVTAGQTATFSVIATGTAPLTYQWQRGSTPILGATSPTYTTPATTSADNGSTFQVVVTDAAGNTPSAPATLTVNPAPVAPSITSQPSSRRSCWSNRDILRRREWHLPSYLPVATRYNSDRRGNFIELHHSCHDVRRQRSDIPGCGNQLRWKYGQRNRHSDS